MWYRARCGGNVINECHVQITKARSILRRSHAQESCGDEHVDKLERERLIFSKASYQLQQNRNHLQHTHHDPHSEHILQKHSGDELFSKGFHKADIIIFGALKKASRQTMGASLHLPRSRERLSSFTWKHKYVELRHGVLTYFNNDGKSYGNNNIRHSFVQHKKRTSQQEASAPHQPLDDISNSCRSIILRNDLIACHPLTVSSFPRNSSSMHTSSKSSSVNSSEWHAGLDDCIFEIVHIDTGKRRLFMAASPEDCRVWVQSIQLATVGVTLSALLDNTLGSINSSSSQQAQTTAALSASSSVKEGALATYARDIAKFVAIQQASQTQRCIAEYRTFIRGLSRKQSRLINGSSSSSSSKTDTAATRTAPSLLTIPISFITVS
jgi:hypothetical protein